MAKKRAAAAQQQRRIHPDQLRCWVCGEDVLLGQTDRLGRRTHLQCQQELEPGERIAGLDSFFAPSHRKGGDDHA